MAQTTIDFSSNVTDGVAGGSLGDNTMQVGDFVFNIQAQGNWTASISGGRFNFQEAPGSSAFTITITTASGATLDFYDYQVSVNGSPDLLPYDGNVWAATADIDGTSWGDEDYSSGGPAYYRATFGGNVPAVSLGNSLRITDQYQPGGVTSQMSIWMDNITFETGAVPVLTPPTLTATGLAPTFTENGAAVDLFSSISAQTKDSGQTFAEMTLTVTNVAAGDSLNIDGKTVALSSGQAGALTSNGNYAVSMNGTSATVTLTGLARSNAQMNTLIDNMSFGTASENPGSASHAVTITQIKDSGGSNNTFAPNITSTVSVVPVDDPHTGGVGISGAATENQVLTATSTLADADGLGTLHYQWQRDTGSGFANVGADQATYTLGDADVGSIVRVVVSYLDGGGTSESATSAGTTTVAAVNDPHTGGVSITGTATEDQVLTATSTLSDADGLGTLHYQWQRDTGSGFVNVGADQATYTLGDADVGGIVRAVVSYTDGQGFAESATSAGTTAVANVNDSHTGGASITGAATENQVLTAVSTIADNDGLGTLHYQWQRDTGGGYVNVGSDQATYTLGDTDVGGVVRAVIYYTDLHGTVESATSAATTAVANINDVPSGGVSITGTATEDQVLTADTSTLGDLDGLGTLHYQWQRNTGSGFVNVGTDQATYALGDADVGGVVRAVVSYVDGHGTAEAVVSTATAAIANVNDPHTGGVSITGTATEDQVLTADISTLGDIDGLGTLHYQWQRDTGAGFVNVGADQATYALGDADVGGVVRAVVSYTDGRGSAESAASAGSTTIAAVNDAHTGGVSITGAATENQVLTADISTLADVDGLGTLHYDWQRDTGSGFVSIGAADQATYTLGDADVGGIVRAIVTYTDGQGFAESATSAGTTTVAAVNDPHTGGVSITGTVTEDQVLTAISTLSDADGLGTLHYQWQRDTGSGFVNVGADQATYTLGDADVGGIVRAVVSYTDGQGFAESATSAGTTAVANINDVPTIGGDIATELTEGDTPLSTGGTLTITDADAGENTFQTQSNVPGTGGYGTFSVAANGVWTYQMNGAHNEFVAGTDYHDSLVVLAADGTPTTISVVIHGAAEASINAAPILSVENADSTVQAGNVLSLTIGDGHFSDANNDNLSYKITVDGSTAIPGWLTFDADTGALVANPTTAEAGNYVVTVTATDGGGLSSGPDEFNILVTAPAAPQTINGTRRNDNLVGSAGDDTINGKRGNDKLTGGDGADTFVFSKGHDKVLDFDATEGDMIDLGNAKGIKNYNDLVNHHIIDTDAGIKIMADDGSWMFVKGLHEGDLTMDMFAF